MNADPETKECSVIDAMREQIISTPMSYRARLRLSQPIAAHRRFVAGGATVAGVAAAALTLSVVGGFGAAPAYAVTPNPDGSVTITLDDLNAIPALNANLAARGTAVRAVPVLAGCVSPVQIVAPDGSVDVPATLHARPMPVSPKTGRRFGALRSITVSPPATAGQTLVVAASPSGLEATAAVVQGDVPTCVAAD